MIDPDTFAVAGIPDRPVIHERRVAAPPADVFAALTSPERVRTWLGVRANIELRIGGTYELLFLEDAPSGSQGSEGCRILAYVPGEMLAFSWNSPPTPSLGEIRDRHTWVVITLTPDQSGTRVRLVHTGMGEGELWAENRRYFQRAWEAVLDALATGFD
jgi:uncharacterized protein YndB with AHSA1/START domain